MFTGDNGKMMSSTFRSSMNFMKSADVREAVSTARLADSRVVNQTVRDFNDQNKNKCKNQLGFSMITTSQDLGSKYISSNEKEATLKGNLSMT